MIFTLTVIVTACVVGVELGAGVPAHVLGAPLQEHVGEQGGAPWYRTPWALLGYAVVAAGVIALGVQRCRHALRRQRQDLKRRLTEQTAELREREEQLEAYNRELVRTNETLRNAIEEKSQLLGVAAHDLKNPLFGIRALAEILLETETVSDKSWRKLDLIRESADETLHLIDGLLASAASSAQSGTEYLEVDLSALTQWVVRGFEPQAERKEQPLHCRVEADGPCVVEGDKQKLREAIGNLVSNALKYSPQGAPVEVVVDREAEVVTVSVRDTGPGLSEDDLERMFAPFQRLTPEPTGEEGSSGLGLYIVKQIADLHEGDVMVDTTLGEGSTFTLVLPATTPASVSVPEVDPTTVEMPESNS